MSADEELLDEALRLLAAAGAEPEVATAGPALRRAHREAPLVLLGADALASGPVRALPRRPGVVVLARGELPPLGWAAAVELGVERVAVLPADEAWVLQRAGAALREPVERGRLIVVGGACGGAGASTLAAAVALAAAAGHGALLVDGDGFGGGLDLLLGAESADGLRWPELAGLRGRVSGEAVLAALPTVGGVGVLAASRAAPAPPAPEAVAAVVEAGRSGGWPVVVDLPRSAGPAGDSLAEAVLAEADLAVLVVPGRVRAACAAASLLDADAGGRTPWTAARPVVRRVPGGLDVPEVARVLGRPVLAELAHDRWAPARGERGEPPPVGHRSPWGAVARAVLGALPAPVGSRS
ncbi:septum site-determining protein Ssd [Trujillonella endophytica]|uniref:Helicase/secretion neighborhood CpaE-like protein n=1 Tax=Trujillonella endophytica TaxID=673521 RepID=A0A1H8WJR8_9ACTN|nr:septum site-determining protein Ssd [Trujillella endophytica]SEP27872.1 helicase/secretion neighborhood CpaE-like protein [Trujillella endophytica]